tara:strand:+ start:62342 stop:62980 length:639 start_codon:yes stop_codon:yes gene_type:complete
MLFWRAKELLEGGSELFRAEAELMSKRVRRLLIGSVFAGVVTLFALLGLTLLTAGVTILLSDRIGWGASLVCVGVAYALLGALMYIASIVWVGNGSKAESILEDSQPDKESASPKEQAEDAKDRLENAASTNPAESPDDQDGILDSLDAIKDSAIEIGMKNPVALGSAALLVVSVLGPGKTIKMISRGAAAAGLASSLLDSIGTPKEKESTE